MEYRQVGLFAVNFLAAPSAYGLNNLTLCCTLCRRNMQWLFIDEFQTLTQQADTLPRR